MKTLKIIIFLALLILPFLGNAQEIKNTKISKHDFALDLGYAYRLSAEPNELFVNQTMNADHYSALRHGIQINFAYDYLHKPFLGFGFKASAFNSSNKLDDNSGRKDDEYIFYVGPSVKLISPVFADKFTAYGRFTCGYMSFRNSSTILMPGTGETMVSVPVIYRGKTFGLGLDLGLDYQINDFLAIGFNTGILGGNVSKLKVGEDIKTLNHDESLYRLDFTLGVRIKL